MHAPRSPHRCILPLPTAWAVLGLVAVAGCGAQEYQRRFEAELQRLTLRVPFEESLQSPARVADTPVMVRVPKGYDTVGTFKAADSRLDALRPAGLELGYPLSAYESRVTDASYGKYSCYLFVFAGKVPAAGKWGSATAGDRLDASGEVAQSVSRLFPAAKPQWSDVSVPTLAGGTAAWQKLRVVAEQEFPYQNAAGQKSQPRMPGVLEIYGRVQNQHLILLAWRVPAMLEQHVQLSKLAPLVAGGIEAEE